MVWYASKNRKAPFKSRALKCVKSVSKNSKKSEKIQKYSKKVLMAIGTKFNDFNWLQKKVLESSDTWF